MVTSPFCYFYFIFVYLLFLLLLFIVFAYSKIRKVLTVVLARSPSWSPGWSPSSSPDFDVSFSLSFRDRNSRQVAVSCEMSMQVS